MNISEGAIAGMLAVVAATSGMPQTAETADPRAILSAAAAAHGGDAVLARADQLTLKQDGWVSSSEQAHDPLDTHLRVARTVRWSFAPGRSLRDMEQASPGGATVGLREGLSPDGGWSIDPRGWRAGPDLTPVDAAAAPGMQAQAERYMPHFAIRQALGSESLQSAAGGTVTYRDAGGAAIRLQFDRATGLLRASERLTDAGVVQSSLVYGDYRPFEGLMAPLTVQSRINGQLYEDLRTRSVAFEATPHAAFAAPAGYSPAPSPGNPALRELAKGVHVFDNMPGDYHSLVVEAGGNLIVVEAPLNAAYGERQMELIRAAFPDRKVTHVVVTHHHGDHTGGLKPWVEAGVAVVAPKGTQVAIQRQLAGRGVTKEILFEDVEGALALGDGRIVVHQFASSHAASNLLAYVPEHRILFQGDMLVIPERGPVTGAVAVLDELLAEIERLDLDVETTVGVHGRPASASDIALALARR